MLSFTKKSAVRYISDHDDSPERLLPDTPIKTFLTVTSTRFSIIDLKHNAESLHLSKHVQDPTE
jgi:hypothetical protein